MRRCAAVLVFAAALLFAASDALSTIPDSAQMKGTLGATHNAGPSKRSLRTVSPPDEDGEEGDNAEERGVVGAKTLAYWSKLAEKWQMQTLAKKLRHKAWLKEGKSPPVLAREYGFLGKTLEELKKDPKYLRYEGFDDLWTLAQYKRETLLEPAVWVKQMKEQAKKAAATNK